METPIPFLLCKRTAKSGSRLTLFTRVTPGSSVSVSPRGGECAEDANCPAEVSQEWVLGTDFLKQFWWELSYLPESDNYSSTYVSPIESFLLGFPASSTIIFRGGTVFTGKGVAGTVSWLRAVLFLSGGLSASHCVARLA